METKDQKQDQEPGSIYDLIIIGGGPAGLSAAIYAGRGNLRTQVLDKNPLAGALGITDKVANYPGLPGVRSGEEILSIFRRQAEGFGVETVQDQVMGVDFSQDTKLVMTAAGIYQGRAVIIATGAMGRTPSIKGEEELVGKGVSYCATYDAAFFRDKQVAITGKIEEVLEELDTISRFAAKVYVITHSKEFTEEQREHLGQELNVELLASHRVTKIMGKETVEAIKVKGGSGPEKQLDVSGIFVYLHGNKPIVDFLYDALETAQASCILVDRSNMASSVEGVFAAGDVTCKEIRQVVLAAAEGCIAALSAEKYLNRRKRIRAQWS